MPEPHDDALSDEELTELRSLVERGRMDEDEWVLPPPGLWDRIAAETGIGIGTEPPTVLSPRHPASPPRSARRRRRAAAAAVTAAAAAAIAIAVVVVNDDAPDVRVVSAVDLAPVEGSGVGRAELVSVDDSLQLRLETEGLDTPGGYFEVWLINPSVTELVSLGPLRVDGEYDVPPGVDAAAFPIVDVSDEPVDGDPLHSGRSVLRGQLPL